MFEQQSLDGFEPPAPPSPPPKANDNLFFAVLPTPDAANSIGHRTSNLSGAHGLRGRPLPAERLHVSLINAGMYPGLPTSIVDGALAAAASVRMQPFELTFDRALTFHIKRPANPLVLTCGDGAAGVVLLRQSLQAALRKAGFKLPNSNSPPHLTLVYDATTVPDHAIEPVKWTVREFVLIHSLVGQTRYKVLGRWPLAS